MERLDKILSNLGYGSRKEVKLIAKKGNVKVNDEIVKDSSINVDPNLDKITVLDEEVVYKKNIYILMNKPQGVVSATFDNYDETVIDLLSEKEQVFDPAPVGRLDKDTCGLLLLTNDGPLNHRLTSPKWHVQKVYYAEIDKVVNESDIAAFKKGITLDDGYKCKEAELQVIESTSMGSSVYVTISEGKFHQVKRMFNAVEKNVTFLERVKFGPISKDDSLERGEYRELTEEELKEIKSI